MSHAAELAFEKAASVAPGGAPFGQSLERSIRAGKLAFALPFDALRAQYAGAVVAGWLPRSLIASGRFERAVGVMEAATLGPLARRV